VRSSCSINGVYHGIEPVYSVDLLSPVIIVLSISRNNFVSFSPLV